LDTEVSRYTDRIRRQGISNFQIHPIPGMAPGPAPEHFVTILAQVPQTTAVQIIGMDLATDPRRREAMEAARDKDTLTLSRRIRVVKNGATRGLALYLPVYQRGEPHDTVEERRRALAAWIILIFSADEFLQSVLQRFEGHLELEAYDESPEAKN